LITRSGPVHTGKLEAVSDGELTVEADGETLKVAVSDVSKANLHFEI
jgi:ribosome maturation factor RimP